MKMFLQVFIVLFIALVGIGFLLVCFIGETAATVMAVLFIAFIAGIIAVQIKQDEKINALEARIKGLEAEHGIIAAEETAAKVTREVNPDTAE